MTITITFSRSESNGTREDMEHFGDVPDHNPSWNHAS